MQSFSFIQNWVAAHPIISNIIFRQYVSYYYYYLLLLIVVAVAAEVVKKCFIYNM
jgi:hypothetical protein